MKNVVSSRQYGAAVSQRDCLYVQVAAIPVISHGIAVRLSATREGFALCFSFVMSPCGRLHVLSISPGCTGRPHRRRLYSMLTHK